MMWKCSLGHQWEATWNNVQNGSGCPKCSNINQRKKFQKYTIKNMKALANTRNGTCLSVKYTNCKTRLVWTCSGGHTWLATPEKIVSGQWCRKCYLNDIAVQIDDSIVIST